MNIVSTLTWEDHQQAFVAARQLVLPMDLDPAKLNAPELELNGWLAQILEKVEAIADQSYRGSVETARRLKDEVLALWERAQQSLGRRAQELRTKIMDMIQEFLRRVIDAALSRVRPCIQVGDLTYKIVGVKVEQTIKFSTSLKSSLESLIELVSEGSLAVSADYGVAPVVTA